jgi:radical SAM superfamily enzyme YgiQ (UPF0313 family)
MNILLVNINRYHYPPVPSIALEYLAGSLLDSVHGYQICDLCFSDNPEESLTRAIITFKPDIAGITIRQVDTALYPENHSFMEEIKKTVEICRNAGIKTVLGGAGFSIMPKLIMQFTGASFGIIGPGELALPYLLDSMHQSHKIPPLLNGYDFFKSITNVFKRDIILNYSKYIKKGGIAGFRTQIGCPNICFFCVESKKPILFHKPEQVGKEVKMLKEAGNEKFHLCDSEFNLSLQHNEEILSSLIKTAGKINWSLYMKPEPYSKRLLQLLARSGARLITLAVDSLNIKPDSFSKMVRLFDYTAEVGIKIVVDLSVGYPGESLDQISEMVDFLDEQVIESIGINAIYRVYPGTTLHRTIEKDISLKEYLITGGEKDNYLDPVYFNYIPLDQLRNLVADKPKFRIEGFEKSANYLRV